MKIVHISKILSVSIVGLLLSACSSNKIALQSNDDVYFTEVKAKEANYAIAKTENKNPDKSEYSTNDNFNDYNNRFDYYDVRNNYSWRDYYYMNRLGYDPFWGPSNIYSSGWSFSLGLGSFNNYYGYNNYYNNGWNNYGYYGYYNNWSPYGGIYSYYRPGYYGNYGNYGSGYYRDPIYTARPNNPRPSGRSYDNSRNADGGSGSIPMPAPSRPVRPDAIPSTGDRTVSSTNPNTGSSTSRPVRPSSSSDNKTSQPTSRPTSSGSTSQPTSRPTREERPSSPPPSSDRSSSSGSTSSGSSSSSSGTSSPRPTRPGGN